MKRKQQSNGHPSCKAVMHSSSVSVFSHCRRTHINLLGRSRERYEALPGWNTEIGMPALCAQCVHLCSIDSSPVYACAEGPPQPMSFWESLKQSGQCRGYRRTDRESPIIVSKGVLK